ncbi:hypothetical protein DFH09DRAFT_1084329 [Mycena vulgaris]|nr:hypothetical protein DFH09DRAFT_1084329 [Mycena vulgaris]
MSSLEPSVPLNQRDGGEPAQFVLHRRSRPFRSENWPRVRSRSRRWRGDRVKRRRRRIKRRRREGSCKELYGSWAEIVDGDGSSADPGGRATIASRMGIESSYTALRGTQRSRYLMDKGQHKYRSTGDTDSMISLKPFKRPTPDGATPSLSFPMRLLLLSTPPLRRKWVSRAPSFSEGDTLNIDLGAFFDNAPSAVPTGSGAAPNTTAVSTPATLDPAAPAAPAPTGAIKDSMDRVGPSDIPPKDKRFDGKVEARQTQRELHSLTQQTARVSADLQQHRAETTLVLEQLSAQLKGARPTSTNLQAGVAANTRDICTVNDRLEQLELTLSRTSATVNTIDEALRTLIARVNGLATAPFSAAPATVHFPAAAPSSAASSFDSHMDNMESLLQQLVSKRGRSPDASEDGRNLLRYPLLPLPLPLLPRPHSLSQSTSPRPPPLSSLLPNPPPLSLLLQPPPAAVAAAVHAPAPVAGAGAPPPLPAYNPAKEARLGPIVWGRNITGESATVIKAILPAARAVMRNYRARRGPDPNTIIACFEFAEIANWFVGAFNAARVSPYENVVASPNA